MSPVAWIADAVWRAWNPHGDCGGRCPIEEPRVMVVSEGDRTRAPVSAVAGPAAPAGQPAEQRARLLETPPSGSGTRCPAWPVCCGRLCTLMNAQGMGVPVRGLEAQGSLDRAYLQQELAETPAGAHPGAEALREFEQTLAAAVSELRGGGHVDGINAFQCRACGRAYVASCHP